MLQESVEMEMVLSEKHIQLVHRHKELLSTQSRTRICFPHDKEELLLIRGSLEDVYFASDLITVGLLELGASHTRALLINLLIEHGFYLL